MTRIALIIPTYNAEADLALLLPAIKMQTLQPTDIFVIDSSSTDRTQAILKEHQITCHVINKGDFNHGGTRRLATELVEADIYLLMTQDAIPATPNTFKYLVAALNQDVEIGCAYARQLPKQGANALSAHGRFMNYPPQSSIRYYNDKAKYGIKTCFNSDNLAAYRHSALLAIGGFPKSVLTAEDAYVAAKLLQYGFAIHYAAEATIFHSHNFNLREEFHRYFSVGVFHKHEQWIIDAFKSATKEGMRFVKSEIRFLWQTGNVHLLPKAILSTIVKYAAYQLGRHEYLIPFMIKKRWGINKSYWLQKHYQSQ